MAEKKRKKDRVTVSHHEGHDEASWAVFLDKKPVYTGLYKYEISYYKGLVLQHIEKEKKRESGN